VPGPESSARAAVASLLGAIALAAVVTVARAEPFRPSDPDAVLLTVPRTADALLADLERRYRESPRALANVLSLAAAHIDRGRRAAEPRSFGRAESILERSRAAATSSADWHVLLADIHQYRHDFIRSLAMLDTALGLDPRHTRARLMRAAIRQTRGEFGLARKDCTALLSQGESALGVGCLAQVLSLTGQLDRAYGLLERQLALTAAPTPDPAVRLWMLGALADMAERRGDIDTAERLLKESLLLDSQGQFVRLALADLWLRQGRTAEALRLLHDQPRTQSVLLRQAEAQRATGQSPDESLRQLKLMMADSRARGEPLDDRDRTRLALLEHRNCDALAAARANWGTQREPTDVRLLLKAASACNDRDTLGEIAAWRASTRYQDAQADLLSQRAAERS
jgi:tetratricopeptide (TPR) repeat protein